MQHFLEMPKRKASQFERTQQPINWGRAIFCGMISTTLMLGFIDSFYMMGFTPFSYELFVGTLLVPNPYSPQSWVLGFLANLVVGAIYGIFYGYCFEYIFFKSTSQFGLRVGLWHSVVAAIAFFPFFSAIHEFMGRDLYPHFGLLGSGMGAPTPILIFTGTLLFGASMGLFYGPVRDARIRAKIFEPGETNLSLEEGRITIEEDHPDQRTVFHE